MLFLFKKEVMTHLRPVFHHSDIFLSFHFFLLICSEMFAIHMIHIHQDPPNDAMRGSFFVAKEIHNFTFAASVQQLGFGLSANCSFPSGTDLPMILEKLRPNTWICWDIWGSFKLQTWKSSKFPLKKTSKRFGRWMGCQATNVSWNF